MKGLLKKEWFVLWNKPVMIILPLALFIIMGFMSKSFVMIMYLPLYAGILPVSLITTDETSRWERFALGMPYSRKDIVSAKYLMSVLLVLGCTALTAVLLLLILNSTLTGTQYILLIAAALAISVILPSVLLPLNLKFGTAKARIVLAVLLAVSGCLSAAAFTSEGEDPFSAIAKITALQIDMRLLALLIIAAAAVLMTVSWAASVMIYRRKQF